MTPERERELRERVSGGGMIDADAYMKMRAERDAARKALRSAYRGNMDILNQTERERDAALKRAEEYQLQHMNAFDELQAARAEADRLRAALEVARDTIRIWHGEVAWGPYQRSPEMQAINKALAGEKGGEG